MKVLLLLHNYIAMKTCKLLFSSFLFLFFLTLQSQIGGPKANFTFGNGFDGPIYQTSDKDSLSIWRENVLLHLDNDSYKARENLFFKAFVLTGPNQLRVSASDVLRVELLNSEGNLLTDQYHKISDGTASGFVEIPKRLRPGTYFIRAYTRWMLNYGDENLPTKPIIISDSDSAKPIKYHSYTIRPEGGHFIYGLKNRAVVSEINGQPIEGKVIDEVGNELAQVVHYGEGLATFNLTPQKGKSYFFESVHGNRLKLSEPLDEGVLLQVNNLEKNKIKIRVTATDLLRQSTYYLRGVRNSTRFFETEIKFTDERSYVDVEVKKDEIPQFPLQLILEDSYGQTWVRRPILLSKDELKFDISTKSQVEENGRKKYRFELNLTDNEGNPVSSEVLIQAKNGATDIPVKEFVDDSRSLNFMKDLKVLAERSPDYSMDVTSEIPDQIKYAFQRGLEFYGQAFDLDNSLLIDEAVQIFINNDKDVEVREVSTNSEGLFTLTDLQFEGDVTMTFRKKGENVKEQLVKVIPYSYEVPKLKNKEGKGLKAPKVVQQSRQMIPTKRLSDFEFDKKPSNLILLEGVTLEGRKILKKASPSVYGIEPDRVVFQDSERPKTLPQLFLGIPGVYVSGLGDMNPTLSLPAMAGTGPILWLIDGFPMDQGSFSVASTSNSNQEGFSTSVIRTPGTNLRTIMDLVPFIDVERVELLFGAKAAVYGSRGSGGVISIYTKNGAYSTEYLNKEDAEVKFKGFQKPLNFDQFFNESARKVEKRTNTSTLYWNPTLQTDENGKASFEISIPNTLSEVYIDAMVVTQDGNRESQRTLIKL